MGDAEVVVHHLQLHCLCRQGAWEGRREEDEWKVGGGGIGVVVIRWGAWVR